MPSFLSGCFSAVKVSKECTLPLLNVDGIVTTPVATRNAVNLFEIMEERDGQQRS